MLLLSIPDLEMETAVGFIALVENNFPQEMFESSVRLMLGDEWRKKGQELIKEHRPDLQNKFLFYTNLQDEE